MNTRDLLADAQARGLLPADATPPEAEARPWPVVLLTGLGAWLAALPLFSVVGLILGPLWRAESGPLIAGLLLLAGAVVVLRSRAVPVFVEQLAVPLLLAGGGSMAFTIYRHLPVQGGSAVMLVVAGVLAALLPQAWLRALLGAAAASLAMLMVLPDRLGDLFTRTPTLVWIAAHATLAIWAVGMAVQERELRHVRMAAWLESFAAGWLAIVLVALSFWSGMTFLVGGATGTGLAAEILREAGPAHGAADVLGIGSVVTAAIAAGVLAHRWPGARRLPLALAAAILVALCALMPALGGVLLAAAVCAAGHRWRLLGACAVAAAWVVGAFYYQLAWPLATKALALAGAGVLLGALAAWLQGGWGARIASRELSFARGPVLGLGAALVATLAIANVSIWQKESLIAEGRKVFVRLAPVDPRSLMQGDFMALNYAVPASDALVVPGAQRPYVIARLDDRGVAQLLRTSMLPDAGAGEIAIELTPKAGRWTVVSDAWFFTEGQGERWAGAKYGEFRVAADGRALLVGLADEELRSLQP